ncbi:MAG TPA: S53 family peptidase [Ktedonobacteraceae bacterium]|nr:S53 family peptidase [Ktedonobacteraceae bacterium]
MPLQFVPFEKGSWKRRMLYRMLVVLLLCISFTSGIVALRASIGAHGAPVDTLITFPGTLPTGLAQSKLDGPTNPQQHISLTISLKLRNANALQAYVRDISNRKSVNFHRYLTQAQFIGAFAPTQATYSAFTSYLQNDGLTITNTYKHRMVIGFSGTVALAEQVFHVSINNYTSAKGETFYSNNTDPLVPSSLAGEIVNISGLNNAVHLHHAAINGGKAVIQTTQAATANHTATSCPGTGSNYYLPSQYAKGYNFNGMYNAGYHGEGQTIALFELDTFQMSDIKAYEACFGQSRASITTIVASGTPPTDSGVAEVEFDADVILGLAPKLGQLRIYEAGNSFPDVNNEWARIIQDAPPIVSDSWGNCEAAIGTTEIHAEANYFLAATAQGQSIFVASSDTGSSGCYANGGDTTLNAEDPATQKYVTGVGGTTVTLGSDGTYLSETTWNNQPTYSLNPVGGATGGGISTVWTMPSWQSAPGVVNSYTSGTPCGAPVGSVCRETPDISMSADPYKGYLLYCTSPASSFCTSSPPWEVIGGTSGATPSWAAFMALTNEESLATGGFNIGFINPLLYQIASNVGQYANDFHDITTGTNDFNALQGGKYPATAGYDIATGLGTLNAANLASDLVSLSHTATGLRAAPASNKWYFAEGSVGGGFQEYLTLQNPDTTQTSNVTVQYLEELSPPQTITANYTVSPSSRYTINVDSAVSSCVSCPHISLAAIVSVTSGPNIVAERPMYFNLNGVQSGTDVLGAISPGTAYYFAEGDSTQAGSANYSTFITMLNPSTTTTANVTITYYTGSCGGSNPACPTQAIALGPLQRGTYSPAFLSPPLHAKVAIKVVADQPIVVERPLYFKDNIPNAGGAITGAASQVGATTPGTDWLFAEGYTGVNFQEYFELANFGNTTANVTIKLEYTNGSTQIVTVVVPALKQIPFDVNAAYTHPTGTCSPSPCSTTPSVSAEITSDNAIVADRLMYFHFGPAHFSGATDVVGEAGPASHSVFAFAEGYTDGLFQEYVTLQNPTNNAEEVALTFFADGFIMQQQASLPAHSRTTFSVNNIINPIVGAYPPPPGGSSHSVSMTVQALSVGAVIVVERPLYFGYGSDQGGTDVIGFTGGGCGLC